MPSGAQHRPPGPGTAPPAARPAWPWGFSLAELSIVLLIMALLATVAYPSYVQQVQRARRLDGIAALANLEMAQERYRTRNAGYADHVQALGVGPHAGARHYDIAVHAASAQGYVLLAQARLGSTQERDGPCVRLAVAVDAGLARRLHAGADGELEEDLQGRCWPP